MLMQIVTYMDQNKSGAASPSTQAPGGIPGLESLPIGKIIETGLKLFETKETVPQVDPMIMSIYKGIQDSYMESFKSYISTINTKNKIADALLNAIEKGTLKIETVPGPAGTPSG